MMYNVLIVALCFVSFVSSQDAKPSYILSLRTGKSSGKALPNIRGKAKIGETEFLFHGDLSPVEMRMLSSDYIIEKNEKATINWHLDRIDQRMLPLSKTPYTSKSNSSIDLYVVDTGVQLSHPEFANNNGIWGGNFVADNINDDCNGHGTHVASLAVGSTYGVAKNANLIAVKVLGCSGSGSYSDIIRAIEWITSRSKSSGKISIVNMSLGGPVSSSLDTAISSSISQGVYYVVAAGNSNTDACKSSPARVSGAVTVAASSSTDNKASFSNYGNCVDVYAPGVNLYAAWLNNGYATLSGTSMASPVTAGTLAVYMTRYGKSGYNLFYQKMTSNVIIKNARGTVNKLVYMES